MCGDPMAIDRCARPASRDPGQLVDSLQAERASAPATLPDVQARAVISVALGMAEDLGVPCAVVLLDPDGGLQVAERAGSLPGRRMTSAIDGGRAALAGHDASAVHPETAGIVLRDDAGLRGALGVSGGPDGFALEACRHAARAFGLTRH